MSRCANAEETCAFALGALPESELAAAEAHLAACPDCRRELDSLRPVIESLVAWPTTDLLRPDPALQLRLAQRMAKERGDGPAATPVDRWSEPRWEDVAPGIDCRLLATDTTRRRVSMLVRLAPGATYPAHTHAGEEDLYLLEGELWIDDRKLWPGDYNHGAPGESDECVWSETGCTCLLITSSDDVLR